MFNEQAAINSFWSSRQRGIFFPNDWFDRLTLDEAYRVQLGLIDRRCAAGERQIGWKVGLTARAAQDEFGIDEPVFGCVLDSLPSGHVFRRRDLISPAFEPQLCLRVTQSLTAEVGLLEICRAIDVVYPALEIIETRGDFQQQMAIGVADDAQQKTVILGSPIRLGGLELPAVKVTIAVNGEAVATGSGADVLGNPLNSVLWLARKLSAFGRSIRAGDLIMTGALTRAFQIEPGDRFHADFVGIGDVQACMLA
jgi:2-keto-4-pentenoate hydratase